MEILKSKEYKKALVEIVKACESCKVKNKVFDKKCKSCKNYQKSMNFMKAEQCPNCGMDMDLRGVVNSYNRGSVHFEHMVFHEIHRLCGEWVCPRCGKTQLNLSGFKNEE